jgi:VWFA-related protein
LILTFALVRPPQGAWGQQPIDVVKVNTDLVVFDVQVMDKKTRSIVGNLSQADFVIADRGVKQTINYFTHDELPLSIILLLDVSDSVRPFIRRVREGALEALGRLKNEDQVAVMAFATTSELVQDFTLDRSLITRGIEDATKSQRLGVNTGFAAAMDDAATRLLMSPPANRSVIIVVTDNFFFTSAHQEKVILSELFQSGSVVYGVLVNTSNPYAGLRTGVYPGIERYVDQTGGEIVRADSHDVAAKLALLIEHLRLRYALGFRPTDTSEDDKFRPVEIKFVSGERNEKSIVVLTRRGYYFRRKSN